jgi:hypothetical protein
VTDEIILSVLTLANNDSGDSRGIKKSPFQPTLRSLQWLDIYGRLSPNAIHQVGLLRLVELRGGLDKIELPGLSAVISLYVPNQPRRHPPPHSPLTVVVCIVRVS